MTRQHAQREDRYPGGEVDPAVEICFENDAQEAADTVREVLARHSVQCSVQGSSVTRGLILLVSPMSAESDTVLSRIESAMEKGIPIYPIFLEGTQDSGRLHFLISSHQWLNASDSGLEESARRVASRVLLEDTGLHGNVVSLQDTFSAFSCSHFTGRTEELSELREALALRGSAPGPVLKGVTGGAGIGKTSLLKYFLTEEKIGPGEFAAVTADPEDGAVDFILWARLLAGRYGCAGEDEPAELLRKVLAPLMEEEEVEDLLFLLPFPGGGEEPEPRKQMEKLTERVAKLLARIISSWYCEQCRILVLDNLHWMDSGSRSLLPNILRELEILPILVIMAYRPEMPDGSPASVPVPENCRDTGEICLMPLGEQESLELLEKLMGETAPGLEELRSMATEAGGWPLHLELIASSVRLSGDQLDLEHLIMRSFQRLPDGRKTLLRALSVLGREAETRLVLEVAAISEAVSDMALLLQDDDFALHAWTSLSDKLAFRQDLLREAVYQTMKPELKKRMHLRAAVVLEEKFKGDPRYAGEVCRHWEEAGRLEKALENASDYLEHVNSFFHSEAVLNWAGRARHLIEELGMNRERARMLGRFLSMEEETLGRLGLTSQREEKVARLMEFAEEHDLKETLSSAYKSMAYVRKDQGRYDEAAEIMQRALQLSESSGSTLMAAQAMANLAAVISDHVDNNDQAEKLYLQALEIFGEHGMSKDQGITEMNLGLLYTTRDDLETAFRYMNMARDTFRRIGFLYGEGAVLTNMANIYNRFHDFHKCLDMRDRASAILRKAGDRRNLAVNIGNRANELASIGRLIEAQDSILEAIELHEANGNVRSLEICRTNFANTLRLRGMFTRALSQLAAAEELNAVTGNAYWKSRLLEGRARCLVETGRLDEALSILESLLPFCMERGYLTEGRTRNDLAMVSLLSGRYEDALDHCNSNLEHHDGGYSMGAVQTLVLKGEALLKLGNTAGALSCDEMAVSLQDESPNPMAGFIARSALGRVLMTTGDRDRAEEILREVAAGLDSFEYGRLFWFRGTEQFRKDRDGEE